MSFGRGNKAARTGSEARAYPQRISGPVRIALRPLLLSAALAAFALPSFANAPETAPRPKWRSPAAAQSFDAEPGVVNAGGVMSIAPLLGGTAKRAEDPRGPATKPAADARGAATKPVIEAVDPALPSDPGVEGQAALAAPGATSLAAVGSAVLRPLPGAALGPDRAPRPKWRPETLRPAPSAPDAATIDTAAAVNPAALSASPRPKFRPKNLAKAKRAERAAPIEQASLRIAPPDPGPKIEPKATKGALCGISGLSGTKLAPIAAGGCGIKDPVRLTGVHGVALSAPATMECASARALSTWVQNSLLPTVGNTGGGVKRIDVAASYACRPRNNQKGQKLSEHGRGKAIDITAIQLKNGSSLSVLHGWKDRTAGPLLKALHRGACGPFGTVLGPNANAFHRDHFHFDTASYRNGAYCK